MNKRKNDRRKTPVVLAVGHEMPSYINGRGNVQGFTVDPNQGKVLNPEHSVRYTRVRDAGIYIAFAMTQNLEVALNVPLNPGRDNSVLAARIVKLADQGHAFDLGEHSDEALQLVSDEDKHVDLYLKDGRLTIVTDPTIDPNPTYEFAQTSMLVDDLLTEVAHKRVAEFSSPITQVYSGAIQWAAEQPAE